MVNTMKIITLIMLLTIFYPSVCSAFTINELKNIGITPTKIVQTSKFKSKNHNEYGTLSGDLPFFILGFKYQNTKISKIYSSRNYSIKFPDRYAFYYDLGSADKSNISPSTNYLSFLVDEFGDVQKDPNVFYEAHDVAHCAILNLRTGCLLSFGGVDDCGAWHDGNSIENAVEKNQFTAVIASEQSYKIDLLSYIKSHRDFRTSKNKDTKEWVQDNFGVENIDACTQ
jgi:hypothetical protein